MWAQLWRHENWPNEELPSDESPNHREIRAFKWPHRLESLAITECIELYNYVN